MIISPQKTTVAYRCPECGSGVMSAVGIFSISADRLRLRCTNPDCPSAAKGKNAALGGNDVLDVVYVKPSAAGDDAKIRLSVPCIFCGKPHTFTVGASVFFGKDIFVLPCPYSGINVGFLGEENHVKAELARSELELLDMLEENGVKDFHALNDDESVLPDPQILDIVTFVIKDLDSEGKIFCRCNSTVDANGIVVPKSPDESTDGDLIVDIADGGVHVKCKKCGAEAFVPTDSLLGAHDFLNCDDLKLF